MHKIQESIIRLLNGNGMPYSEIYKALEIRSNLFDYHVKRLLKHDMITKHKNRYGLSSKGQAFYPYLKIEKQPITAVVIIIQKNNKIVLVKRNKHAFYGYWALPGGKICFGETIDEALQKICQIETGLRLKDKKYIATIQEIVKEEEDNKYHFIILLYKVKAIGELKRGKLFCINRLPRKIIPSDMKMLKTTSKQLLTSMMKDNKNKIRQEFFG